MQDKFTADEAVQYSLGQPSVRTGLGGFSMKVTAIGGVGFISFLLLQLMGLAKWGFALVLPLTIVCAVMISVKWAGRSLADTFQLMWQNQRRKNAGGNLYFSGAGSRVPLGKRKLPGLLARTEMLEGTDTNGHQFGVILDRPRRDATIIFDCQLTGQTAMTQAERNMQTAEWSHWLSGLSLAGNIKHAVIVVGSYPGTGELISHEVKSLISPTAPAVAKTIMQEAAEAISVGIPEVYAHISVTYNVEGDMLIEDSFVHQLSTAISPMYESLAWAGILAHPMSAADITARAHVLFNPASEQDFEQMAVDNENHGLSWDDAGPSSAITLPGVYHHDGCASVTWEMKEAPRSSFEDTLLHKLIQPHDRLDRKRVALVYRPYESGTGASRVEDEHRDAMVAANSSKKLTSARAEMRLEHTNAARHAQSKGAQLGRYSMFVTATTDDPSDLRRISTEVVHLAASSSIRLQVMKRQQDVGFQVSCGLGQVPWDKATTSKITGE